MNLSSNRKEKRDRVVGSLILRNTKKKKRKRGTTNKVYLHIQFFSLSLSLSLFFFNFFDFHSKNKKGSLLRRCENKMIDSFYIIKVFSSTHKSEFFLLLSNLNFEFAIESVQKKKKKNEGKLESKN
ncbi:hypothetical protein HMI55_001203 [Coelomomyces lativittatus]|nr:hypothetical protein HMI55_001203 [Coelomomyces lativittatus]